MKTKTTTEKIAAARVTLHQLIETNSPLCARYERLINNLKAQLAQGK